VRGKTSVARAGSQRRNERAGDVDKVQKTGLNDEERCRAM
jgi:hypothetical protein